MGRTKKKKGCDSESSSSPRPRKLSIREKAAAALAKFRSEWANQKKEDEKVPAAPIAPTSASSSGVVMGRPHAIPGTVHIGESTSFPLWKPGNAPQATSFP